MHLANQLKGLAVNALLNKRVTRTVQRGFSTARKLRGAPRRIDFYFQTQDAHSYVIAQLLPSLARTYGVEVRVVPVHAGAADVNPCPQERLTWAMNDTADIAPELGVAFPTAVKLPEPKAILQANEILIVSRPWQEQLEVLRTVADALWTNDSDKLSAARGSFGSDSAGSVAPTLAQNYARLRKRGHYAPASVYYEGQWYVGPDRLVYLEQRLQRETGIADETVIPTAAPPPREPRTHNDSELELQFFFSLRSPYVYLALERTFALADAYGVKLTLRPVLPMIMRGLQVPGAKQLYIGLDAKREADRLGVPFGRICVPSKAGIRKSMALLFRAGVLGREREFMQSFATGVWSEARDCNDIADMRTIATRAGLEWNDMKSALDDTSWLQQADANAKDLSVWGLWGVPTFQIGDRAYWGQDRLGVVERKIRSLATVTAKNECR